MKDAKKITLNVDGAPYYVTATPQQFNSETQYQVSVNGGDESMFAFDAEIGRYRAVGTPALDVPDNLESAIGDKLNSLSLNG